ncbi:ABC transporter substrate-binding protein [Halomonas organivorans]|uniref:Iron complex transport system substrate-binding protein n=1 Tax=Halomonas organivorans TaxID=257772 RepID=A0A7W5BYK3_9GAMM|nr:ABC transporter substrate-binding protein [Halomonas organivorans]MBB3141536.1 iron complex transport system substrate-binding protein [Halomonas organivorans]
MKGIRWCMPALALGVFALPSMVQAHEVEGEAHGPDVVSFDWGAADTLAALGLEDHLVGLPHQAAPAYVADLLDGRADVGGLKTPDLAAVAAADPDLILVTGRQSAALEDLEALAETQDVSMGEGDYFEALSAKVTGLAERFGAEARAAERLAALHDEIEAARASLPDDLEAVVVTHNDGHYSLREEPVVGELLQIAQPALPASVEPMSRGTRTFTPLTPAAIGEMAPDALLVVDRSAAIGATPLDVTSLEEALAAEGGEAIEVTVLSPALWYLSGDGLQSVRAQVQEVTGSLSSL